MIRAVLDTNVLVSAVIARGVPNDLVATSRRGAFVNVSSPYIIEDFRRVMTAKLGLDTAEVDRVALAIARTAEMVPVFDASRPWCGDMGDNPVIETAVQGGASHLVTGDRRLLTARVETVEFITPADFALLVGSKRLLGWCATLRPALSSGRGEIPHRR
ncbi:MAG: putative toxin-antitoxin system toxin component, PIN family [Coriobacteriia bacterium]|nr:putative toxin-antitoxin system toxin component, PIN family [Coriobacteriia bacterium]